MSEAVRKYLSAWTRKELLALPYCGGMDKKPDTLARVIATKPRNWRERRQKARVIAQAYRRRKPEPVWEETPF